MNTNYIRPARWLSRIWFYISRFSVYYFVPARVFRWWKRRLLTSLSEEERAEVRKRLDYYNRMEAGGVPEEAVRIGDYRYPYRVRGEKKRYTKYFFDMYGVLRGFDPNLHVAYVHGDVTEVPPCPAFVKSRPIGADNRNSVLLKLNRWRHFVFVDDRRPFRGKLDKLVSRNVVRQPHRARFLEMYIGHPLCNVGKTNRDYAENHPEWVKGFMRMEEQLEYKFVACIEGNDVATNLKWVMSSNSVAVMPRPSFETWFMEGTLVPDCHYIEIRQDYSDLTEKLEYYIARPDEAERIVENAHRHVARFTDKRLETAIQLAVVERYMQRTGQLDEDEL